MEYSTGPSIVRHTATAATSYAKPGLHSHNETRQTFPRVKAGRHSPLYRLRMLLLILGVCSLGYYGYSLGNAYIYQAYGNWAFDQQIAGRRVAFADYVREKTPFGFFVGAKTLKPLGPTMPRLAAPTEGALLGRVEISRLNLSAIVREGVDAKTLGIAVGHVPSTALPGQAGNFAIAAHRDTLFRGLKDIRKDDMVTFQSPSGSYTYQVFATEIVKPTEVSVLQPDGGGLITPQVDVKSPEKLLTMITCYPFYYVGSAPKRFIVEAKLISATSDKLSQTEAQNTRPPIALPKLARPVKAKSIRQVSVTQLRRARGLSRLHASAAKRDVQTQHAPAHAAKKPGFWHRLLHG